MAGPGHGAPGVLAPVYLEGTYSEVYPGQEPRRGGAAPLLQAVLLPRRDRQPLHARDPRLDPRGRRARLRALARLRRGLRQPRPDRRRGRRRRRGRDRPARDLLAHQQVPQPGARRRGAAGAQPQRLQDQQPDAARAHQPRGAGLALLRLRLDALLRRGLRPGEHAPGDGGDPGPLRRRDPRAAGAGPRRRRGVPPALADDRAAHARRGGRRPRELNGHQLEGSWRAHQVPIADVPKNAGAPGAARGLDAQLPARGAVRRRGPPRARGARAAARRRAPHGRQPARQRRHPEEGAAPPRLPRLRGRRREAGRRHRREHPPPRRLPARHDAPEHAQLPRLRPRRERPRTSSTRSTR